MNMMLPTGASSAKSERVVDHCALACSYSCQLPTQRVGIRYEFFYTPDGAVDLDDGHYEDAPWCWISWVGRCHAAIRGSFALTSAVILNSWAPEANLWQVAAYLARGRHMCPPE